MSESIIYLDHAAATPLDTRAFYAMQPFFTDQFYNPSSAYAPAIEVRRHYDEAKRTLAKCIGVKSDELVMTAGATESINLAIHASAGHAVTSSIEHPAVLEAVKNRSYTLVVPDSYGLVSADSVKQSITDETTLVSIGLANNEIGTIQPLRDIAAMVREVRSDRLTRGVMTPIYFHTDASQGAGVLDLSVSRLGVDMMTVNSGKVCGPKQMALLWADRSVNITPLIYGGGQERNLRSGTENIAGAVGFAVALEYACQRRKPEEQRLRELRDALQVKLMNAFADMIVSGHPKKRLPGHLHVSFPGLDGERLLFLLEMRGVLVATGSACAANKGTRSHVLTAIGMNDEQADGSLRMTLGRLNDKDSMSRAADVIIEVVNAEKTRVGI